jgi:hypothetical protein
MSLHLEKLRQYLFSKSQSDAEEDAPYDTSYGVFHKEPAVYTPMSLASTTRTTPFSVLSGSFEGSVSFAPAATPENQQCVHRKWEELADMWKTTVGAPGSPEKQAKQLGGFGGNHGLRNNQLLKLAPLSSSQHSLSSPLEYSSTNYLLHTPILTRYNVTNGSINTTTFSTPNRPFRPYGFEWSSNPQSRGARTSRLTTYIDSMDKPRTFHSIHLPTERNFPIRPPHNKMQNLLRSKATPRRGRKRPTVHRPLLTRRNVPPRFQHHPSPLN